MPPLDPRVHQQIAWGNNKVSNFWFEEPRLAKPIKEDVGPGQDSRLFPRECRESGTTYKGPFSIKLCWATKEGTSGSIVRRLGSLPIMTCSSACHLNGLRRSQLVAAKVRGAIYWNVVASDMSRIFGKALS